MLVFENANLEQAITGCAFGSFIATGQTCIAGTRLLVQRSVYDEVVSGYVDRAKRIGRGLGDPMDESTLMGPLISEEALERVKGFVASGLEEGADVLCGGAMPEPQSLPANVRDGHFYLPTVLACKDPSMRVVQEEVFGPVVVALPFDDEDEAVALANDSPFGLAAAVWTENVMQAHR